MESEVIYCVICYVAVIFYNFALNSLKIILQDF